MDIRIRHAEDRDCQSIVNFLQAALQDMESVGGHAINRDEFFWQRYAENIVEFVRKDDRLYLLAQTNSSIVGFLEGKIFEIHAVFSRKKSFHISVVYVVPKSRQQGIASSLVQKALRWASEQGCQEADLNVLINNTKAKGLYKKLGFKVFQYELRMKLPPDE